jgi:hypothetical protein
MVSPTAYNPSRSQCPHAADQRPGRDQVCLSKYHVDLACLKLVLPPAVLQLYVSKPKAFPSLCIAAWYYISVSLWRILINSGAERTHQACDHCGADFLHLVVHDTLKNVLSLSGIAGRSILWSHLWKRTRQHGYWDGPVLRF